VHKNCYQDYGKGGRYPVPPGCSCVCFLNVMLWGKVLLKRQVSMMNPILDRCPHDIAKCMDIRLCFPFLRVKEIFDDLFLPTGCFSGEVLVDQCFELFFGHGARWLMVCTACDYDPLRSPNINLTQAAFITNA